jgi:UDP-N-acetylglucosamine--N-acetylmuramyl-(pentapeptide) pyrophosphoryl-undecaprenol N-acetylglucosamine transferase
VCRGGASTVAELAATGLPSIIVPLPIARRKEQHANARMLTGAGAARIIDDADATAERLDPILTETLGDTAARARMADGARSVARPDAAEVLASWIADLAGHRA